MDTDIYPLPVDTDYNAEPAGNEMDSSVIYRGQGTIPKTGTSQHR
jgi:hypothetical protein